MNRTFKATSWKVIGFEGALGASACPLLEEAGAQSHYTDRPPWPPPPQPAFVAS
jgi:hypothetical protein